MNKYPPEDDDKDINYDPMMPHMSGGGFLDSLGNALKSAPGVGLLGAPNLAADAEDVASRPELSNTLKAVGNAGGMNLSPTPTAAPFSAPESAGHVATTNKSIQKPTIADVQAPQSLPGIPQGAENDTLSSLLGRYKQGLDKYGPDQQMAVQKSLIEGRTGLGPSLARAGGGLADSIMQGVARAGSSNFQKNITDHQNQMAGEQMATMKDAQAGNMAKINAEMGLDAKDPNSTISKSIVKAYSSTLTSAGVPPSAQKFISGELASDIADKGIKLIDDKQKMELEQAYRMAGLGLQADQLKATIENQKSGRRMEGLKGYGNMPWYSRALHPEIAGALEKEAGLSGEVEHPQAQEAESWARSNPNDPRSAIILKRIGK